MIKINQYRDPIYDVEPGYAIDNTPIRALLGRYEEDLLDKLINTFEINRLAYLRHGGLLYLTFPSATFSRLSHALGTVILSDYLLRNMRIHSPHGNGSIFKNVLKENKMEREFVVAAFIHDIGHLPYSYILSDIPEIKEKYGFHHKNACEMLSERSEVYLKLQEKAKEKGLKTIIEVLKDSVDFDVVKSFLCFDSREQSDSSDLKWVRDVLWSPLGINEFDNFNRTSFFIGEKRGTMKIKEYLDGLMIANNALSVYSNSVDYVLFYLWNRDVLKQRIFEINEISAYHTMLQYVVKKWLSQGNIDDKLRNLLFLTEFELTYALKSELSEESRRVVDMIFSWRPYKYVGELGPESTQGSNARRIRELFEEWLSHRKNIIKDGDVLIYIPKDFDLDEFHYFYNVEVYSETELRDFREIATNLLDYLSKRDKKRRKTVKFFVSPYVSDNVIEEVHGFITVLSSKSK